MEGEGTARVHAPTSSGPGLGPDVWYRVGVSRGIFVAGVLAAACVAPPAWAFDSVAAGATVDAAVGVGPFGDTLMFEVGGESEGLRSYGHQRWLLQWDVLVAARAGWIADQYPFLSVAGAHTLGWTAFGVRLDPTKRWTPYLGARLGGDALIMGHPGLSIRALDTVGSVDGAAGIVATGIGRIEAGASFLNRSRSLLLVGFVQESLHAAEVNTPRLAFTEGGLALRYDIERGLVAELEAALGATASRTNAALGFTDQTIHGEVAAGVRKIFRNGMWMGASALLERYGDHVVYEHGASYATADPFIYGLSLSFGMPLWRVAP